MLILRRKRRQQIRIGEAMITIIGLTGNAVRVGIEAPAAVDVVRGELLDGDGDQDVLEPVRRRRGGRGCRG